MGVEPFWKNALPVGVAGLVVAPEAPDAAVPAEPALWQDLQHPLPHRRLVGGRVRLRHGEAEELARAEVELLYRLTDAVNRASTLEEVFEPALDAMTRRLRVPRCSILLFDPDGVMRFRAWRGLSDRYRQAVEGHSPWKRDTPDPQPITVPDVLRPYMAGAERIAYW